jgi:hypothetical protein
VVLSAGQQVVRVPRTGGAPTAISTSGGVAGFALGPSEVYWSDSGGEIWSAPLVGGSPQMLASVTHAYSLVLSGGTLFWVGVDPTAVVAQCASRMGIWQMPPGGGSVTPLVQGPFDVTLLVGDDGGLAWVETATVVGTRTGSSWSTEAQSVNRRRRRLAKVAAA